MSVSLPSTEASGTNDWQRSEVVKEHPVGVAAQRNGTRGQINRLLTILSRPRLPEKHIDQMMRFKEERGLGKLRLLASMEIAEAFECVQVYCDEAANEYLGKQLEKHLRQIAREVPRSEFKTAPSELEEQLRRDILYASTVDGTAAGSETGVAQKALELDAHFNGANAPYRGLIDWIGNASEQNILQAHEALQRKADDAEILAMSLKHMIVGGREAAEATPVIRQLLQLATTDPMAKSRLRSMVAVAAELRNHGYELPIFDIMTLAEGGSAQLLEAPLSASEKKTIEKLVGAGLPLAHAS